LHEATAPGHAPETLGDRYDVISTIRAGATARVVSALDRRLDRRVAIKIPRRAFTEKYKDFRTLFEKEAIVLSSLPHPNIIPLYDCHETDLGPALVMRFVEHDLGKRMIDRLESSSAIKILGQIASALDHCAECGYSHRDVKPDNILVDEWDHAYLIDFGFAAEFVKDASWKSVVGAMPYISPEALLESTVRGTQSQRTKADQFSLGVLAYQALTGHFPLNSANAGKYPVDWAECTALRLMRGERMIHCHERNSELTPSTDEVFQRMISLDPAERFVDSRAAIDSLARSLEEQSANRVSVIVSYSRADEDFVRNLASSLERCGYSVWFDALIDAGTDWDDQIENAMLAAEAMIVVLSPDFCNSIEAKKEWKYWLDYIRRPLLPLLARECRPPYRLSSLQHMKVRGRNAPEITAELDTAIRSALRKWKNDDEERRDKDDRAGRRPPQTDPTDSDASSGTRPYSDEARVRPKTRYSTVVSRVNLVPPIAVEKLTNPVSTASRKTLVPQSYRMNVEALQDMLRDFHLNR
jgi:serine/threonine protein kinase